MVGTASRGALAVQVQQHVDDRLVAEVQTVEDADRDDRVAARQLRRLPVTHDNHVSKLPVRRFIGGREDQLRLPRIVASLQDADEVALLVHRRDLVAPERPLERDALAPCAWRASGPRSASRVRGRSRTPPAARARRRRRATSVAQRLERQRRPRPSALRSRVVAVRRGGRPCRGVLPGRSGARARRCRPSTRRRIATPRGPRSASSENAETVIVAWRAFDLDAASREFVQALAVDLDGRDHRAASVLRAEHRRGRGVDRSRRQRRAPVVRRRRRRRRRASRSRRRTCTAPA